MKLSEFIKSRKQKVFKKLNPPKPIITLCKDCKQPLRDGKCFTFFRKYQGPCWTAQTENAEACKKARDGYYCKRPSFPVNISTE